MPDGDAILDDTAMFGLLRFVLNMSSGKLPELSTSPATDAASSEFPLESKDSVVWSAPNSVPRVGTLIGLRLVVAVAEVSPIDVVAAAEVNTEDMGK